MNTIKINKENTKLIAHRGLSGIETENTNAAFVAAGNRTYYGIETDIYRTADGKFAVNHDGNLKRIAGEDINVEGVSLETLQSAILYDKIGGKVRRDLRISSLEEYLFICKKYEKHAVLELKSDFCVEEIEKIIETVNSFDYLNNLTFISFRYSNLEKVRSILPKQSAQFLFSEYSDDIFEKLRRDKIDIDANHNAITEDVIKKAHEAGLTVNAWTVDNPERAEFLSGLGIDFITTNILE